ncbi:alpha-amylase/4-alpha-glucanotransferase domain-containing protein [Treponema sp.]|uniref:alpha-amylase/4-alpha-glucanotransferase domain-containing protein n=1 Tax=Treponema sp. TaxID=166 RepID=UPI002600FB32|nr:alpha-amylase/4-alpha-glucanotransferase domain-containing protein [Treponema sp.]MCR5218355.1 DUF1926 domain-containing protein [Treponema sp.]
MALNYCIQISSEEACYQDVQTIEKAYQQNFKTAVSFLYSHPSFPVTLSVNGVVLSWIKKTHPEVIEVLRELLVRKQIELLGGGYYSPVFPLLFPVDRSGQIEKLTTTLREITGKRPTGISIFYDIWDPSLISTFQSCGMEYIILDSTLIPSNKSSYLPLIVSEQGRSLKVISSYKNLLPLENESGEDYVKRLAVTDKNSSNQIAVLPFKFSDFVKFIKSDAGKYLTALLDKEDQTDVLFTLPAVYLKKATSFIRSYIPAGMNFEAAQWAKKAFVKSENKSRFPITIHDYLNTYTENKKLCDRMMFISMLISQCHGGDKVRKHAASDKLWQAQSGYNFINVPSGSPAIAEQRQNAYKNLNEAELLIRQCKNQPFQESFTSYDYNTDGLNEYLFQMENLNAVIDRKGGIVEELDSIVSFYNYAASLSRLENFDGCRDFYNRGLFVEHLLDDNDFETYIKEKKTTSQVFSQTLFEEKKIDTKRFYLLLEGKGIYSSLKMPVSLRKSFTVTSSGFMVQYILKNESPLSLKGNFVSELNFTQTNFALSDNELQYTLELLEKGGTKKESVNDCICLKKENISNILVKDKKSGLCFVIEPNEECNASSAIIDFSRPTDNDQECKKTSRTLVTSLYWNVDLGPGMEMEKNINLSVISVKKNKK